MWCCHGSGGMLKYLRNLSLRITKVKPGEECSQEESVLFQYDSLVGFFLMPIDRYKPESRHFGYIGVVPVL